jgi:hypothetical protein
MSGTGQYIEPGEFSDRSLHPSFTNKHKAPLQVLSQAARFENVRKNQFATIEDLKNTTAVPTTFDTYYDPSHPDADWSGMVSSKHRQKKHTNDHISQKAGLVQTEHGIITAQGQERQEFSRKRVQQRYNPITGEIEIDRPQKSNPDLIGGINLQNDEDRWKSAYKSFESQEKTNRDQLTFIKRQLPKKMINDPAQARPQQRFPSTHDSIVDGRQVIDDDLYEKLSPRGIENTESSFVQNYGSVDAYNSIGNIGGGSSSISHAIKFPNSGKSLLSNIGQTVSRTITVEPPKSTTASLQLGKTLITQNYKPTPGYTGKRMI